VSGKGQYWQVKQANADKNKQRFLFISSIKVCLRPFPPNGIDRFGQKQGDQMILLKERPKCSPTHTFVNINAKLFLCKK
jgi:hypothetical protein